MGFKGGRTGCKEKMEGYYKPKFSDWPNGSILALRLPASHEQLAYCGHIEGLARK